MNSWILSHKKQIGFIIEIGQTLVGVGICVLAWLAGSSFFGFFKQIINLIPTSANQTPLSLDGRLFLASFPLVLLLCMTFGLWIIIETQWVTNLGHVLNTRFQKWLAKHFTSYDKTVGDK